MKELCNEFESTGKDWSQERTEYLYSFGEKRCLGKKENVRK